MKPLDILKKKSFINDVNANLFLKILLFYFFCILILPKNQLINLVAANKIKRITDFTFVLKYS
ncbi:MAG: hypothetical protein EAZ53_03885 [Bacteroidetes bacterium]|nr:MAG: hypothetical protein EAZ53_03885 [Bacteroidota bacterium]